MSPVNEPLAVIGTGCRFPGDSSSPSKLWELLSKPRDVQRPIDRFAAENWHNKNGSYHGASNVLDAYLLSQDAAAFDASFFNIAPGEAESIDPQQRVLLEVVYETLESAGIPIESLQGTSTAAYVGVMCDDYTGIVYGDAEAVPKYAATGTARSILSNRLSYFFNWTGPCMTIDTACSSSLVAVHQAAQVLRDGTSKVAVAAGSNLILAPSMFIAESNLSMLSKDGRSRMWDDDANGYARGEGVAAIILKTLSNAIADGDHIECIIRETGVNMDGRTPGITMPSSKAQSALISDTYRRAGLDVTKPSDRPQYFEAHGTGTKAGDPQEASAIHKAFFGEVGTSTENVPLRVGSIKTVIGHTEGTAGLAGLIKASLAIQNKTIPANLLFKTPNPEVLPYLKNLQIPLAAESWPELPAGVPRRASVNSFGFGGANAHAILENYEPNDRSDKVVKSAPVTLPFTFSAPSEKSLVAQMQSYAAFIKQDPSMDLNSVAWNMSRRTAFNFRTTVAATTSEALIAKIESALENKESKNENLGIRPIGKDKGTGIVGVFTGQGAQWPAMGAKLISASPAVETVIDEMERSLAELPESDRPAWSLKSEMMKQGKASRVSEGMFSQPLCTAVQVALVNLLHAAGINFEAVVGHSSGEIGAAYAAGLLNARDAIRIAYYRGFYAKLAKGPNGEFGAMLAAGTSMEDAQDICDLPFFDGRISVAASNSSASVTISGDAEAVSQVKDVLEDESKFARALKVDTAYHSHHMYPCAEAYTKSLDACNIQILTPPENGPKWYSSVSGGEKMDASCEELKHTYWRDNMVNAVLFSQALTEALADIEAPAIGLEVGPHPALKGPATMTIEESLGHGIPYAGTLGRGADDVEALAASLGFIWTNYRTFVNFFDYAREFGISPSPMKTLPTYAWDHGRTFWYEARAMREQRLRKNVKHEMLGVRSSDSVEGEYRWRNYINPAEISWLKGHVISGQVLYPASGFAAMAVEASKVLAPETEIKLVKILNYSIHRALSFPNDSAVETIFTLNHVKTVQDGSQNFVSADFACDACLNKDGGMLSIATGQVILDLGEPLTTTLPDKSSSQLAMTNVNVDTFYESLSNTGYNYAELFKGIASVQRTIDFSAGTIHIDTNGQEPSPFTIHPAPLDVAFQSLFAAIGAPGDGRLWTLQIPTMIERLIINPAACPEGAGLDANLDFEARLARVDDKDGEMAGDIDVYNPAQRTAMIRIEGLHLSPLAHTTAADDKPMFGESVWGLPEPDAKAGFVTSVDSEDDVRRYTFNERACLFYLKRLHEAISPEEYKTCESHAQRILDWASNMVSEAASGNHSVLQKEWLNDTYEDIQQQLLSISEEDANVKKTVFVGERLIPFVRGELSMLEEFDEHDLLDEVDNTTGGIANYNAYVGSVVKQIAHRYPHMDIVEIGSGTGSATQGVVNAIGHSYSSYTFTDISAGFFEPARRQFKDHSDTFQYKVLDIEKDVGGQEFPVHSYDLVVAANVFHATKSLDTTLNNARRLLKPGGYLVLLEITNVDWLCTGFFFSGFPGWWVGAEDGRVNGATVSQAAWDEVFRRTGFSGIDTATPQSSSYKEPYSVMVTQAVDTQMSLIRQPLAADVEAVPQVEDLVILGPQSMGTYKLAQKVSSIMKPYCTKISVTEKLEDVAKIEISKKHLILSLVELDEPAFKPFTTEKYDALQKMTKEGRNILWVVQGSKGENPYSNMMLGFARCLNSERPGALNIQFLDIDAADPIEPTLLAETLLKLHIWDSWKDLPTTYSPMWTLERELYSTRGTIEISRYLPVKALDDLYNSTRRLIRNPVDMNKATVEMIPRGEAYELVEYKAPMYEIRQIANDATTVSVKKSITTSFKVKGSGFLYLVTGIDTQTQQQVIALSENHRSIVTVPKAWTVKFETSSSEQENNILRAAASELVAESILGKCAGKSSVLVHEPSALLAKALSRQAEEKRISLTLTSTTSSEMHAVKHIERSGSDRALRSAIPQNLSVFVNLSAETHQESVGARLERQMPYKCKRKTASSFYGPQGYYEAEPATSTVSEALARSHGRAIADILSTGSLTSATEIGLLDILDAPIADHLFEIVNWKTAEEVPVKLSPPEDHVRFRGDKTYFLVGLTGELGLSLSHWMIARGARHLALTSRNPSVDPEWLRAMEALGATIKVLAMDVTSRSSLMNAYKELCDTMPPVAGVANAAMVLKDGLFENVPYDHFKATLRPKVDGTALLDELFSEDTLDFFMAFSSLTYTTGNLGQSAYSVANSFMVSAMEGRRKRGLAGSVINTAGIFGIGYINRMDKSLYDYLSTKGYANISEWDFHQFFAQGVFASPHDSGINFEVSNGLKTFDPSKAKQLPAWIDFPRFANFKRVRTTAATGGDAKAAASVRVQLKEQTSEAGVLKVLQDGLIAAIHRLMHIPVEGSNVTLDSALVELGMDSLVAVDMRTWFANELDVDVPVLKLLGGSTVSDLVAEVQDQLSPELIPNVKGGAPQIEEPKAAPQAVSEAATMVVPDPKPAADSKATLAPAQVFDGTTPRSNTPFSEIDASELPTPAGVGSEVASQSGSDVTPHTSLGSEAGDNEAEYFPAKPARPAFERTTKMSFGTASIWFQKQLLESPTTLNIHFRLLIKSNMSVDRMENAIEQLGQRHEVFRTAFFANAERFNEPTLGIMPTSSLRLEKKAIKSHEEADEIYSGYRQQGFDIENGETIKVILLTLSPSLHYLIFNLDHIGTDGFSFNMFLRELGDLYEGRRLPPIQRSFSEFADKQRKEVESGKMDKELQFWRSQFPSLPEPTPLFPMAKVNSRQTLRSYKQKDSEEIFIDAKTSNIIKDLCRRHKATKFHFFMAVFKVFLLRLLDTQDVTIGLTDANRTDAADTIIQGYLTNVLPMRFGQKQGEKFADVLKEVREKTFAALSNSRLPFDVLLETLQVPRASTHAPLLQILMNYRQMTAESGLLNAEESGETTIGNTANDFILNVTETATETRVKVTVQTSLYSPEAANTMLKSYMRLIKTFALKSDLQLGKIALDRVPVYDDEQIKESTELGQGEVVDHSIAETALDLVEKQAKATPSDIAIKDDDGAALKYSAMMARIDAIAATMLNAGAKPGAFVAVFQEPTADWVCSLLAIWKIGAAFVPLDPRSPAERLSLIITNAQPSVILYNEAISARVSQLKAQNAEVINVSSVSDKQVSVTNQAQRGACALCLYTSGSTGVPKGVMLSHAGVLDPFLGMRSKWGFGARENFLQQTAVSFDPAFTQVLASLTSGGFVYVAGKETRFDPAEITRIVKDEGITSTMATPSEYFAWFRLGSANLRSAKAHRIAIAAGEPVTSALKEVFLSLDKPALKMINNYGPVETSLGTTSEIVNYHDPKPATVGSANPSYALYIVDADMKPVPAGVDGEIVIGGPGVALGYRNNDELTAAKFVDMPFHSGSKIYHSGDLGRMQADGSIVYVGRIAGDTQVKVNGIRMELTDVENSMIAAADGKIVNVIASARGDGKKILVAHVEVSPEIPAAERQRYVNVLAAGLPLPKYMIPSVIVPVEKLPLNSHGKTDRKAVTELPIVTQDDGSADEDAKDLTPTEEKLKDLWVQVIPSELAANATITANSDFFRIGGDSLQLVNLQSLIRSTLFVSLPMVELFETATLREMGAKVDSSTSIRKMDWAAETALEPSLLASRNTARPAPKSSNISVLMTGPTGYVGSNLVRALVADRRIATINVISRTGLTGPNVKPRDILSISDKIVVHSGDMAEPNLGLSDATFDKLAEEVDIVLHSGANRSFWDTYDIVRAPNFLSTKELTRLAARRNIPLHFISSAGVLGFSEDTAVNEPASSVAHVQPPIDGSSGYVASKWAAEAYLANAAAKLNLPISIHRVTAAQTTELPAGLLDEFAGLAQKMNALPDAAGWSGSFDLVQTAPLCVQIDNAMVESCAHASDKATEARFIHHPANVRLNTKDVEATLGMQELEASKQLPRMPAPAWVGQAKLSGIGWHFASQDFVVRDMTFKR